MEVSLADPAVGAVPSENTSVPGNSTPLVDTETLGWPPLWPVELLVEGELLDEDELDDDLLEDGWPGALGCRD
ncbi:hypothetical protein NBRC116591_10770 [Sessilibacter corallicola]|uniref:Uncharacterized protein n=1 Tax=Sessilibacter corallicola TaxID=2904075 RepID=A0ABQ0A6M4_9GAMM